MTEGDSFVSGEESSGMSIPGRERGKQRADRRTRRERGAQRKSPSHDCRPMFGSADILDRPDLLDCIADRAFAQGGGEAPA